MELFVDTHPLPNLLLMTSSASSSLDATPSSTHSDAGSSSEMTIGDLLAGQKSSEFLASFRALFERAAEEKRRVEREKTVEKKRKNLEMKVDQILQKKREEVATVGQIFKGANSAAIHDKKMHKKSEKKETKDPFTCEECGKQFASQFQLREHVSILHLRERKYACEVCGQKFGRRGGVRRHVQMVHLNQMHKCPYEGCDHPGYKCSKALAAHIRSVHTNVRPYKCDECGKDFVRRNDLKMHELTHTEGQHYKCACGSSFRRTLYLKKHQKTCPMAHDDSPDDADSSDS